jgi:hypothetical protein
MATHSNGMLLRQQPSSLVRDAELGLELDCGDSGRTGPIASKNCAVVACQSSMQRSPPVHRRGSGAELAVWDQLLLCPAGFAGDGAFAAGSRSRSASLGHGGQVAGGLRRARRRRPVDFDPRSSQVARVDHFREKNPSPSSAESCANQAVLTQAVIPPYVFLRRILPWFR